MAFSKSPASAEPLPSDYMLCETALTQDEINSKPDLEKSECALRGRTWWDHVSFCTVGMACLVIFTIVVLGAVGFYFDLVRLKARDN